MIQGDLSLQDRVPGNSNVGYLRTNHGAEIDIVIERPGQPVVLVEIKSTERLADRDVSTLNRFAAHMPNADCYCLSRDPNPARIGKMNCRYWLEGLSTISNCEW